MSVKQILTVLTCLSLVIVLNGQWIWSDDTLWRPGDYALLAETFGCPTNTFSPWKWGQVNFRTEYFLKEQPTPKGDHLFHPIWPAQEEDTYLIQYFCLAKKHTKFDGKPMKWPRGSYCIQGKILNICPKGFSSGQITWLTGNITKMTIVKGTPVAGSYFWDSIKLSYCCRSDGPANETITLPSSSSFYLYRKGGLCQKVRDVEVTEEYMRFDTLDTLPGPPPAGNHPDVSDHPDIKQHLCYYSREGLD